MAETQTDTHSRSFASHEEYLAHPSRQIRKEEAMVPRQVQRRCPQGYRQGGITAQYYSTEDKKIKLTNSRCNSNKTKLKASLVPGAVVILLAGRFKGRRAVFLKQLDSGLCLITGPYKVNGIPLRRVPQSCVIGTSTVVDASGVNTDDVSDTLFKKPKATKKKA